MTSPSESGPLLCDRSSHKRVRSPDASPPTLPPSPSPPSSPYAPPPPTTDDSTITTDDDAAAATNDDDAAQHSNDDASPRDAKKPRRRDSDNSDAAHVWPSPPPPSSHLLRSLSLPVSSSSPASPRPPFSSSSTFSPASSSSSPTPTPTPTVFTRLLRQPDSTSLAAACSRAGQQLICPLFSPSTPPLERFLDGDAPALDPAAASLVDRLAHALRTGRPIDRQSKDSEPNLDFCVGIIRSFSLSSTDQSTDPAPSHS